MRRLFGFQSRYSIPVRYKIVAITILALFLFSNILSDNVIAAHASNQKLALHRMQKADPNDGNGTLLWQYQTDGTTSINGSYSPIVANGVVYYGANDGSFYALNANTGSLLWSYKDGSWTYTPTIANGIVYVDSGILYALNANTGSLLWQFSATGFANILSSAPTVANGTVYVNSLHGILYALNASNGALLWTCSCGSTNSHSGTAVANGTVYVGTDTNYVDALNANTGTLLWQYQTNGPILSTPAVANGVVYALSSDGYFYALNAGSGSFLWHYPMSLCSGCIGFILTTGNGVVYASSEGILYALNTGNGSLLWSYGVLEALALVNGVIYVGGYYNDPGFGSVPAMDALDANTGSLLWSYHLSYSNDVSISGPVAFNGVVYFGAAEGSDYVYAVTAPPPAGPQGTERLGGSNPSELGQCTQCAGDPVDTYSGNFSHTWSDLSIPGRGVPLLFNRTYNAQAATVNGPLGYGWTDSYNFALTTDNSGNVTIQQEDGSTVTFAPNPPDGYTAPSRVLAKLVQNSDGTYTFTRKDQVQYIFNSGGQLIKEIDRNGYVTSLSYQNNKLASVTDPAGRSLTFSYGSNGLLASVTDPIHRSVSFQYDTNNNLIAATDVNGGITSFTYDSNHLMLTMKDPNGGIVTNVYDSNERVTAQTDAMQRKTMFSYGTSSTTITDPNGDVSVEQYQNGLLTSETKGYGTPQAATWSYTYDPVSLGQASITDPNGHVWTQSWDASGNLLSSIDPLKRTTTYTYDYFNDMTSMTDALGVTTTYTYDASGNLLSTSTPLQGTKKAQITTYTYGDSSHPGDITAMTDPDSKTWTYTYDASGDRASMSDPLGDKTAYQYNGIGWQTVQVSPEGYTTSFSYDTFGDIAQVTDPLGHTTTSVYDANRNLVKVTDAVGHVTLSTYDVDNELTQVTRADGSTLAYGYDGDGNRTSYTDSLGHKTTYAYGNAAFPNAITAMTDPLGRTTNFGYDKAGNRISLTNPAGQVTTYTYDTANELTKIAYSDGKTPGIVYSYDKDGQQLTMTDGTGKTTYKYNSLHQIVQSTNGAGSTMIYGYDLKGQMISLTYPGGHRVTRTYDAAGRLKAVKDWLGHTTSFTSDPDGNLATETYPNGVKATFKYDKDDQIISITDSLHGTVFLKFTYTRTALSLLASLQTQGTPQGKEIYGYTSLNQISTVNQPTYSYDKGDNLTQSGSSTLSYDAANEVTSLVNNAGTTTFSYDSQGNRTSATAPGNAITTYTYNQANQLTRYSSGSTTAQYTYNGDGLRMSKTVGGTPEAFTWDTVEGLPLILQDGTTLYVTGPGGLPLEQVNGTTVLYYHQDQSGSTRALTDSTGTVAATYAYDAYGNITGTTGSVTNPFQYTGQYTDTESGLQYLRARYYDPGTGQFMTADPLGQVTLELYTYTYGDPINRIDPSGLWTAGLCGNASAGFFAGVTFQGCVVFDKNGVSLTGTVGGGIQTPDAGISIGPQVSDANTAKDLSKTFTYAGGSVGDVVTFGGQSASGKDCQGNNVHVLEGSVGLGIPPGGEVHGGVSYTGVTTTVSYATLWHLLSNSIMLI